MYPYKNALASLPARRVLLEFFSTVLTSDVQLGVSFPPLFDERTESESHI